MTEQVPGGIHYLKKAGKQCRIRKVYEVKKASGIQKASKIKKVYEIEKIRKKERGQRNGFE